MALFKKKDKPTEPKEPKKSSLPDGKDIFENHRLDVMAHSEWDKRAKPDEAYEYFETNQMPTTVDSGTSYWVQINRIRESHKTRMGILTNAMPTVEVYGRGKDASDRERIKLWRYMIIWMLKESGFYEEYLNCLHNYDLVGMGWLRARFDKAFITSMDTIGMTVIESLDPRLCFPHDRARKSSVLDGQRCSYVNHVTKEEFEEEWGNHVLPDGKKLNVSKIFRDIEDKNHPDFKLNAGRSTNKKEITVVEYEYRRMVPKEGEVGNDKIQIMVPEYRIALAAGYEKLIDYVSPINDLRCWQKVLFSNDPMHDIPYSSSDFQAEKELQDLWNVMVSMTIDNMARQMNSPWSFYEGSLVNEDQFDQDASKPGGKIKWKYTKEMLAAQLPPNIARPQREPPGQVSGDWLHMLNYIPEQFDRVSVKNLIKGEQQPGVTSGKQAQLMIAQGMQPSYYTKQKLSGPLKRIGQILYHHAKTKLTDEMELPVDDQGIGVDKGIIINRQLTNEELTALVNTAGQVGDREIAEKLKMVSIRKGNERISLADWFLSKKTVNDLLDSKIEVIENDMTFGNYNVQLTVDPMAEASRQQRAENAQGIAQLLIKMGAVKTGLKYLMEAQEIPDRDKVMEDAQKEIEEKMQSQMAMQGGQIAEPQ